MSACKILDAWLAETFRRTGERMPDKMIDAIGKCRIGVFFQHRRINAVMVIHVGESLCARTLKPIYVRGVCGRTVVLDLERQTVTPYPELALRHIVHAEKRQLVGLQENTRISIPRPTRLRIKLQPLCMSQTPDSAIEIILEHRIARTPEILENRFAAFDSCHWRSRTKSGENRQIRTYLIPISLAKLALNESVNESAEEEDATPEKIISAVCGYFKQRKEDLLGKGKKADLVKARQICAYLMCEMLSLPLVSIGNILGGRDHTTIMYARDKMEELEKLNPRIQKEIDDIKNIVLKK